MASGWTPERRALQSAQIHRWRPWKLATGPTTIKGKARAAKNAYKGGTRGLLRMLARELRAQPSARS